MIGLYETFKLLILDDPGEFYQLARGTPIFVLMVAYNEDQALDALFSRVRSLIGSSPFFRAQRLNLTADTIHFLDKNVVLRAAGANSAGLVGRDLKCLILDEVARYKSSSGGITSGWSVYQQLSKGTRSFGVKGYRVLISSPWVEGDIIHTMYEKAKSNSNILAYWLPTWEMNPKITRESLNEEYKKDPITAERDFGAIPMPMGAGSISKYFPDHAILTADETRENVLDLIWRGAEVPRKAATYILTGDPAERRDAFGIGLAHNEDPKLVIDGLWRFVPTKYREIDPLEITEYIMKVCDVLPVGTVIFDTWQYPELQTRLKMKGIEIINHIVRKPDYDMMKDMLFDKRLQLCNYPFLLQELRGLDLRNGMKVDHPYGGSKDVADCVANAVWYFAGNKDKHPYAHNLVTMYRSR
jgi:hypothetical protein